MTLFLKSPKLINRAFSRNPVFIVKKKQICCFCKGVQIGRPKFYASLWELHAHMIWQHKAEPRWKCIITKLADEIIEEMKK